MIKLFIIIQKQLISIPLLLSFNQFYIVIEQLVFRRYNFLNIFNFNFVLRQLHKYYISYYIHSLLEKKGLFKS